MTADPQWLTEAARAAAEGAFTWNYYSRTWGTEEAENQQYWIDDAARTIRSALPIIEAGLREQIACEIETHQRGSALRVGDVWQQGRDAAARIARGKTSTTQPEEVVSVQLPPKGSCCLCTTNGVTINATGCPQHGRGEVVFGDPQWLPESIAAASRGLCMQQGFAGGAVHTQHTVRRFWSPEIERQAAAAVCAALPIIEAGLRNQIADEIEDADVGDRAEQFARLGLMWVAGRDAGMTGAADIARGES